MTGGTSIYDDPLTHDYEEINHMRHQRVRTAAVGVDEAKAFVDAMETIDAMRALRHGWAGPGSRAPGAKTTAAAQRLMRDRQAMASRLRVEAVEDGSIRIHYRAGEHGMGDPGHVHLDAGGRPAIVAGADAPDEDARHPSTSAKLFRKELDAIISPRPGRYGIKRVEVDGIMFDSADEGKRYRILKSEEAMGLITDLRMQVAYPFQENGRHCFTYKSDFNFVVVATGEEVVEDVKGVKTDVYKLKKKLIEARYGIEITEWPVSRKEMQRRAAVAERKRIKDEKEQRRIERERVAAERRAEREAAAARKAERASASGTKGEKT